MIAFYGVVTKGNLMLFQHFTFELEFSDQSLSSGLVLGIECNQGAPVLPSSRVEEMWKPFFEGFNRLLKTTF